MLFKRIFRLNFGLFFLAIPMPVFFDKLPQMKSLSFLKNHCNLLM